MQIRLPYGRTGLTVELPEAHVAAVLNIHPQPPLPDQVGAVAEALQHPIGTEPLADLARRASNACIVVCDVTRPVPNRTILPPLLECLESQGLAPQDITLLIATGTHRPNEGPELEEMIGAEVARRYRVINHNARADEEQQYVGDTRRGVPAYVDRIYVQSDLKIITGLVEPPFHGRLFGRTQGDLPRHHFPENGPYLPQSGPAGGPEGRQWHPRRQPLP
jgi:nickel-dependent lactate racemase